MPIGIRGAVVAVSLLLWPSVAQADSDGFYCAAPGYIAYETRFSQRPASHLLHVVVFSNAGGFTRLEPIPLPEFQVHRMSCGPTVIDLAGWTTGYTVDITDPSRPAVTERRAALDRSQPAPANLGYGAKPGVLDLERDTAPGQFQLVISRVSRPVPGGIEHYIFSRVIRRGPGPGVRRILASLTLFEGIALETVD